MCLSARLCVCLPVCIACVWVVNPCICLSADCRISGSESRQPLLLLLTSCRYFSIYLSTRVAMKIGFPLLSVSTFFAQQYLMNVLPFDLSLKMGCYTKVFFLLYIY